MRFKIARMMWAASAALALAATGGAAVAAPLGTSLVKAVQAATFEVVLRKPTVDNLTYEKPLPLELLPFEERTDPYFSVGTAFAIGNNRYATAAHVVEIAIGSQFGAPLLRDSSGAVHAIERVVKYSNDQDFAVLALREPPRVVPLPVNGRPEVNTTVYAVGNALGQGVVIRDGLYTSETPEQIEGRWKWLRFSAAASPGSSGGPLLDARGRVIGVVIGVSPNENLNYALPIGQVLEAAEGRGRMRARFPLGVPVMPARVVCSIDEQYDLPATYAEFDRQLLSLTLRQVEKARTQFMEAQGGNLFPKGAAAQRLLHTFYYGTEPRLIQIGKDSQWDAVRSSHETKVDLSNDGRVISGEFPGAAVVRLVKPGDVSLANLYRDSRLFMDLVLRGVPLMRSVGPEQVRVTSLGPAQTDGLHVDSYGRKWQVRTWPLGFIDLVVVAYALPMPYGYIVLDITTPTRLVEATRMDLALLADLLYAGYTGGLPEWREYLAQKSMLPAPFAAIDLAYEYEKAFRYRSARLELTIDPAVMSFSERSQLTLQFAYFPDGGKVVWDVAAVELREDRDRETYLNVARHLPPADGADSADKDRWRRRKERSFPFDGTPVPVDRLARTMTILPITAERELAAGSEPTVLYKVDFGTTFGMTPDEVRRAHRVLVRGVKIRE